MHVPGGRRIHTKITPSLGGIAIFLGFLISTIIWIPADQITGWFPPLTVLFIPFLAGLTDDLLHLKPIYKLIGQALTASLIFFFTDTHIVSFYGLFGSADVLPFLLSYVLTVMVIVFITNSFNLIDGVDGLAGMFSLVALLFFGSWFQFIGHNAYSVVCFSLAGAVVAFLLLNWEPAKIFMGETGSLVLGVMLSVFAIEFLNYNQQLEEGHEGKFSSSVGMALCVLIIPITDTIRIIILRVSKKVSPFVPDKRHIHHCLVRLGLSHRLTVSILCTTHLLFISVAILMRGMSDWYLLSFVVVTSILLSLLLEFSISRHTYTKK